MYNCSLFIVTTNHKGEGQVSYKYNKHVRQLKSLHMLSFSYYIFYPSHGIYKGYAPLDSRSKIHSNISHERRLHLNTANYAAIYSYVANSRSM